MKTKTVTHYVCDHCGKVGHSAGHMTTHEKHCTMNSKRKCRLCDEGHNLAQLIAMVPSPEPFAIRAEEWDFKAGEGKGFTYVIPDGFYEAAIARVHDAADECPLCTFAALRQSGVPMFLLKSFKLKEELADWWDAANQDERNSGYGW